MGDKEMAANLERIHNLYLDREEKPVEKVEKLESWTKTIDLQAAWWVEYVCRHGGADWLKSIGEDVPFYQYHHLDILLVLTVAALISLTGTFFFWRTVFRYHQSHQKEILQQRCTTMFPCLGASVERRQRSTDLS